MTPRYTWTPASEPPDSARQVVVWMVREHFAGAHYLNGSWYYEQNGAHTHAVLWWRDLDWPPTEGKG